MKVTFLVLLLASVLTSHAHAQSRRVFQCRGKPAQGGKAILVAYDHSDNQYVVDIKVTHPKLSDALTGRFVVKRLPDSLPEFSGKGSLGQSRQRIQIDRFSDPFFMGFGLRIVGGIPGVQFIGYGDGGDFMCEPAPRTPARQ